MLIAFTYWSKNNVLIAYKNYVFSLIYELAILHPQVNLLLITNEAQILIDHQPKNLTISRVSSSISLIKKFKEEIQFNKLIKQHQPQVIVNLSDTKSLKHTIPQISLLHYFPVKKEILPILKSKKNVVFQQSLKTYLTEKYFINEQQIEAIFPAAKKIFQPINNELVNQIKDGYTDGRIFFMCNTVTSESEELITILKAFAQFKKWQKTNMKLMVVSRYQNLSSSLQQKISTFKFKDDVVVLENISDEKYAHLLATSYALIHISNYPLHIFPLIEAIQTNTAIISSSYDSFKEIIGDAGLLIKENTTEAIANAIQELYKNENLRNKIIEYACLKSKDRSIEQTAQQFWQIVQNAIQV